MFKFYHIVCFVLVSLPVFSQVQIQGKVINEQSNEPIPGASIYFNNTSIGTTTNALGNFQIMIPGFVSYELIVSSIGFEPVVYTLKQGGPTNYTYTFKLKKKEALLQEILMLPDASRRKYLELFRENFLGITEEADSSTIENQGAIYFTKPGTDKNSFNAYSDTPLIIINNKLGYKIYFQLKEFNYNESSGITSFYGFTRYEELGDEKRWVRNRQKVYYGSTMHFFRSLISDKLNEESYKLFIIKEDTLHRRKALGDKPFRAFYTATAAQILKPDSINNNGNFIVSCKNEIMVRYSRNTDTKSYLIKMQVEVNGSTSRGFQSYLTSPPGFFEIDKNGIVLNPLSVVYTGFWIYEKAANSLPYNYDPGEKK